MWRTYEGYILRNPGPLLLCLPLPRGWGKCEPLPHKRGLAGAGVGGGEVGGSGEKTQTDIAISKTTRNALYLREGNTWAQPCAKTT